jgi:hypothetical protein
MMLLTDGRVLVHEEPNCSGTGCVGSSYSAWYTLTPSSTGSYANGTWTQVASLPSGYEPLFFGSAVLPDGNVVVQGGEYNCPSGSCSGIWQNAGALYNPATNTWTATTAPFASGVEGIGDAESVILPNGTWMLAACCAKVSGASAYPDYFYFNESSLNFTSEASSSDGKADEFDEEGWTLLPNGEVLTVDAYVGSFTTASCASGGCNSELYNPSTNKWSTAGSTQVQLWDSNCSGSSSTASYEVGPAILMPNGTVFYNGASDCRAGNTATYNWSTGAWTAGPSYANSDATNDAPASIEVNGNAIVMASPYSGTFSAPANFYEWNGSTLSSFPNPSRAADDSSYVGHLLVLPTGQIMFTDFSTTVELLTSAGTYESSWQPTITSVPSSLTAGTTYTVSGTQFNGVSDGAAYGDDFQDNTNYPLVRIVNNSTGNVVYCKTHGFSVGVGTGSTVVSTSFDVPSTIGTGASELYVVTNGIPSAATAVTVSGAASGFSLSASPATLSVAQGSSGTSTITSTVTGGFDSAITLTASGQPTGVTVGFSPSSITGAGTSTMTMTVASTTATGTYPITVTGTSGSTTETTTVTLTVTAATAGFSISASPTSISIDRSSSGKVTITTTVTGGFDSAITLSATGEGSANTITFSPTSITGAGTSTMTIKVGSKAATGDKTITVKGTSGSTSHTTTVTLDVLK